jgi:hypothetical protein
MKTSLLLPFVVLTLVYPARADVLELKNGKTLNGKYLGGTAGTIRFETGDGVQVLETSQALALTFTDAGAGAGAAAPAAAAPAAAPPASSKVWAAPAAAPAPIAVTVPAGTTLLVRMVDAVSSRDAQGKRFTATLESDLAVGGTVVAPAGTKIYGRIQSAQQARRLTGQSSLDLRLSEIAVGPNLVPIVTSGYTEAGARSVGKAARGAAAGAAIGAIADGGEGAGKGAAIGALATGLKKGEAVSVNSGTLLEFQLQQPVNLSK